MTEVGEQPEAPRTVVQRDGKTQAQPTVVQRAKRRDEAGTKAQRRVTTTTGADHSAFPEELRDRFEPIERIGEGSEAVVWHVRSRDDRKDLAVKVHWPRHPVDTELLKHLRTFHDHVPDIYSYGRLETAYGIVTWIALEYLPVSLRQLMAKGALPLPRAKAVVAALAEAVQFWHEEIERNPLDFKPDNILLRSDRPPRLVIADFGGTTAFTASQVVGQPVAMTPAYAPPEQLWDEIRSPWPWWGVGEIAHELVTGTHRFQRADGTMAADPVLRRNRVMGEADLSAVKDERWKLLISGLLTREPEDRWGYAQVREWLDGGSPPVIRPQAPGTLRANRPITFTDGRTFHEPAALAGAMLMDCDAAAEWLAGDGESRLLEWLTGEVKDKLFDTGYLRGIKGQISQAHRVVTAFGAAFAPEEVPRFRGRAVDENGLRELVGVGDGGVFLRELVDNGILAIAAQYRCGHPKCEERCQVLGRVARQVRETVGDVARRTAEIGESSREGSEWQAELSLAELEVAYRIAARLALEPRSGLPTARRSVWDLGVAWWVRLRQEASHAEAGTPAQRTALTCAAALEMRRNADQVRVRDIAALQVRRLAGAVGSRLLMTMALALSLLLVTWPGAFFGFAFDSSDTDFDGTWGMFGMQGGSAQFWLLPALVVGAAELVALARGRTWVFVAGLVAAAVLGFTFMRLPGFSPATLPTAWGNGLIHVGGLWGGASPFVAFVYAVAGLVLCVWASGKTEAWRLRLKLTRADWPVPTWSRRRFLAAPLLLGAMLAVTWSVVVVRMTLLHDAGGVNTTAGVAAAELVSAFALVFTGMAVLPCLLRGGGGLAGLFMAATVVFGLLPPLAPLLQGIQRPVLPEMFISAAEIYGPAAFWAALLLALPLAVLALRYAFRLLRPVK